IEIRPPSPRFAPVADGALRIALPRFAKRTDRFWLGEGIHHLKALVEIGLGLSVFGRDRVLEVAESGFVTLHRLRITLVAGSHGWRRLGQRRTRKYYGHHRDRRNGQLREQLHVSPRSRAVSRPASRDDTP